MAAAEQATVRLRFFGKATRAPRARSARACGSNAPRPIVRGTVLGGITTQLIGRVMAVVLTFVTLRLAAAGLRADDFGNFSLVSDFTTMLVCVSEIGLGSLLARELATGTSDKESLAGLFFTIRLVMSVAVLVVSLALIPLLPYSHSVCECLVLGFIAGFFGSLSAFPSAFFQAYLRLDLLVLGDLVGRVITVASIAAALVFHLGLPWLVSALVVGNVFRCVVSFVLARRFWRISARFDWGRLKPHLKDSGALGLATLFGVLHFKSDVVFLSVFYSPRVVGVYSVGFRFLEQAIVVGMLIAGVLMPVFAERLARPGGEKLIRQAVNATLAIGVVLSGTTFVLARPLISLVAGDRYGHSVIALQILSLSFPFVFGGVILTNVLVALNRRRALVFVPLACLVLNSLLNLYLIPRFGVVGAASTTVATEAVSFVVLAVVAARIGAVRLALSFCARLVITTTASGLAVVDAARFGVFIQLLGFLVIFGCVASSLRILRRSDVQAGIAFVRGKLNLSPEAVAWQPAMATFEGPFGAIRPGRRLASMAKKPHGDRRQARLWSRKRYLGEERWRIRLRKGGPSVGPPRWRHRNALCTPQANPSG